jgi:hypothetical protein
MKTMTETSEKLVEKLGPEFLAALDALDAAETAVSDFYKKLDNHDDGMMFLRYCASLFAMKAASYAGTAIIDHGANPIVVFETVQNRTLAGLHCVLQLHEETCPHKGTCGGGALLKGFLAQMMGALERTHAEAAALARTANPTRLH